MLCELHSLFGKSVNIRGRELRLAIARKIAVTSVVEKNVDNIRMGMVGSDKVEWNDRTQFFAVAARSMRQVLVDHARARGAEKRGGGRERVPLATGILKSDMAEIDPATGLETGNRIAIGTNNSPIQGGLDIAYRTNPGAPYSELVALGQGTPDRVGYHRLDLYMPVTGSGFIDEVLIELDAAGALPAGGYTTGNRDFFDGDNLMWQFNIGPMGTLPTGAPAGFPLVSERMPAIQTLGPKRFHRRPCPRPSAE